MIKHEEPLWKLTQTSLLQGVDRASRMKWLRERPVLVWTEDMNMLTRSLSERSRCHALLLESQRITFIGSMDEFMHAHQVLEWVQQYDIASRTEQLDKDVVALTKKLSGHQLSMILDLHDILDGNVV